MPEPLRFPPENDSQQQQMAREERASVVSLLGEKDLMICGLQAKLKVLQGELARLRAPDADATG